MLRIDFLVSTSVAYTHLICIIVDLNVFPLVSPRDIFSINGLAIRVHEMTYGFGGPSEKMSVIINFLL